MFRKVICIITLAAFIVNIVGCTPYRKYIIKKEWQPEELPRERDVWITLNDGSTFKFSSISLEGSKIKGITEEGRPEEIDMQDVKYMWFEEWHKEGFAFFSGLIVPFVVALITSCPFVYSYDGENFVFDSEPFGGAISRFLERTDYDVLNHITGVNGRYRLKLTNELDETQFTDELRLIVVDHPKESRIITDHNGHIHTLTSSVPPSKAYEVTGKNIIKNLETKDHFFWQGNLFIKNPQESSDLEDELIFEFPKPVGAETAKLILNVCNTPWSIYMSKRFLSLMGGEATGWLSKIGSSANQLKTLKSHLRNQAFLHFELFIWENNEWKSNEYIPGASPLVPQDRIAVLDVSNIHEDKLRVKIRLGAGFWMIDNAAVDYSEELSVKCTELKPHIAIDHKGCDIREDLCDDDNKFFVMPETGDYAHIEFLEPSEIQGMARSVVLKASGYYEIHLSEQSKPQVALLQSLLKKPDALSRYSVTTFHELFNGENDQK